MLKTISYKKNVFKKVYFEISNICNLKCSFCPETSRKKSYVNINDFKKVALELKNCCEELCPHIVGEPFTHPDILEIFKICESIDLKLNISTNGLTIKSFQENVLKSKIVKQINFSLQCFKDNFPDKDIKPYLEDILSFCILANKTRPELYINLRLWNLGADEKDNEEILCFIEKYFSIKINRKVDVKNIKSKKIWNNVRLNFDSRFEWPEVKLKFNGTKGTCYGLKTHFGILADGTVVPCCLDKNGEILLGNVFKESVQKILESERVKKIQNGFNDYVLVEKLCQHCSFIKRFRKKTMECKNYE